MLQDTDCHFSSCLLCFSYLHAYSILLCSVIRLLNFMSINQFFAWWNIGLFTSTLILISAIFEIGWERNTCLSKSLFIFIPKIIFFIQRKSCILLRTQQLYDKNDMMWIAKCQSSSMDLTVCRSWHEGLNHCVHFFRCQFMWDKFAEEREMKFFYRILKTMMPFVFKGKLVNQPCVDRGEGWARNSRTKLRPAALSAFMWICWQGRL